MELELMAYGIVGSLWWICSASIFFPFVLLLKLSKSFRDKWFSFFFMNVSKPLFEPLLIPLRKKVFELLHNELKKEKENEPNDHKYEVLEIGMGGGANLAFYPENCVLTAQDMNPSFETYFNDNKVKYPNITFKRMIHGMAENMKEVSEESIDILVCTYVLCSVDEMKSVLAEVKRVLKPNGIFLFLEHVAYKSRLNFTLQKSIARLWTLYFDGCHVDRDTRKEIEKTGFSNLYTEEVFPSSLVMYVRPNIYGIARK